MICSVVDLVVLSGMGTNFVVEGFRSGRGVQRKDPSKSCTPIDSDFSFGVKKIVVSTYVVRVYNYLKRNKKRPIRHKIMFPDKVDS